MLLFLFIIFVVRRLLEFICEQYWWIKLARVVCIQFYNCILYCSSHVMLRQWSLNHKKPSQEVGKYFFDQVFMENTFWMVSKYVQMRIVKPRFIESCFFFLLHNVFCFYICERSTITVPTNLCMCWICYSSTMDWSKSRSQLAWLSSWHSDNYTFYTIRTVSNWIPFFSWAKYETLLNHLFNYH